MTSLAETNRLITSLAQMITAEKVEAKDPFWNNGAKIYWKVLWFLFRRNEKCTIKEEKITMTSIRNFKIV